jgi:hypothetical protein
MKKIARRLTICAVLFIVVLGTTLSGNSVATRADPHRDQACIDACNAEFQVCFPAARGNRREMARCRAERQHCIAHCK